MSSKKNLCLVLIAIFSFSVLFLTSCKRLSEDSEFNIGPMTNLDAGKDAGGDTGEDAGGDAGGDQICDPDDLWCEENWVIECNSDGTSWQKIKDCTEQGLLCAGGKCMDTSTECAEAINEKSYIGCEYWAVTLANVVNDNDFNFAIAVTNNASNVVNINVSDNSTINRDYKVPASGMLLISDLPWKKSIKTTTDEFGTDKYTRKVPNSAYHLTSDKPVTVYQFNPLNYYNEEIDKFSFTGDASLLLPTHVYQDEYIAISRPSMKLISIDQSTVVDTCPGYVAIVGPADGPCTLEITTTAHLRPSSNISNEKYDAFVPGDTFTTTVAPFEVLQLLTANEVGCTNQRECERFFCCDTPPTFDITGTIIKVVDGPSPAVFGGHECAFVPFDKWACDHLEQQLFPLKSWGRSYICAHGITQASDEPTVWRIVSGSDENIITFTPARVHDPVILDKGKYIEFESIFDFSVKGTGRVSIAHFMVGQNYSDPPPLNGDPSMSLAIPVEQYRKNYTFFAPETYINNYLTIIHLIDNLPLLDGAELTDGTTSNIDDVFAKTSIEITGGFHEIESKESTFSLTVYGVGNYTSYMYPGGLNLNTIEFD